MAILCSDSTYIQGQIGARDNFRIVELKQHNQLDVLDKLVIPLNFSTLGNE